MVSENSIPQATIDEFVRRAHRAAGSNLESVVLYGSAASGDFHAEFSNLNVLCIVRETSLSALAALQPAVQWWDSKKQPPPLMMTRDELHCSADVFPIELMDMQKHHRVLVGEDPLLGVAVSPQHHRTQVEYELREKLILLRQHAALAAGDEKRLQVIILRSVSSIATLFRHALIIMGEGAELRNREAISAIARKVGFDPSPIQQALDIRERRVDSRKINIRELLEKYLSAVEKVVAAVDETRC